MTSSVTVRRLTDRQKFAMIQIDALYKSPMSPGYTPNPDGSSRVIEEASDWFARLRSADVTPQDHEAFEGWKSASPMHEEAYRSVCRLWDRLAEPSRAALLAENAGTRSRSAWGVGKRWSVLDRGGVGRGLAIAAMIAVLTTAAAFWIPDALHVWQSDVATVTGERKQVALVDGSTVLLNTESALAIPAWQNDRRITLLKGEAAFVVIPNPDKPFVVSVGNGEIRVLGTKFSIRKHPDRVTVIVSEGTVTVQAGALGEPVQLEAAQQVSYDVQGVGAVTPANLLNALAWQREQLVFTMEPLAGVIDEVNRYHDGAIILANPTLRQRVVSGVFATNDPVRIIDSVTQALHVRSLSIAGRVVLLY